MNTKPAEKKKVLFIATLPCVRLWRTAKVLQKNGWEVYLGQMQSTLTEYFKLDYSPFKEVFEMSSRGGFHHIKEYFDIVHSHNEPDTLSAMAALSMKNSSTGLVHDCHDFVSAKAGVRLHEHDRIVELMANTFVDLAVYCSEHQYQHVQGLIRENMPKSVILFNAPLEEYIPKTLPDKKVNKNKPKIVYAGTIREVKESHRYFIDEFMKILKMGYELYVYAPHVPKEYDKMFRGFRNAHNMGHCNYPDLIKELSQYDFGIMPFQITRENYPHLRHGLPNKLFEYFSAGLPVISKAGMDASNVIIEGEKLGYVYNDIDEIRTEIPKLWDIEVPRFKWTADKEVENKLLPAYEDIRAYRKYNQADPKREVNIREVKGNVCVIDGWKDGEKFTYKDESGEEKENISHVYGKTNHDKDLIIESFMREIEAEGALPDYVVETSKDEKEIKKRAEMIQKRHKARRKERKKEITTLIKNGRGRIPYDEKMILISGMVLCKNEQKTIENTITSLYYLCDEIIVQDNMSTDDSMKIVKKYPKCRTSEFDIQPWDFSVARNNASKQCRGKYIAVIDADEELDTDPATIRQQIIDDYNRGYIQPYNMHTVQIGDMGTPTSHLTQIRIYPNNDDFKWARREHNQIKFPDNKYVIQKTNWQNFHFGFLDPAKKKAREERANTYIEMLKVELAEMKEEGIELLPEFEKVINLTKYCCFMSREDECLELGRWGYEQFKTFPKTNQGILSRFLISFSNALIIEGNFDEAEDVLNTYTNLMGSIVDSCFLKHVVSYRKGQIISSLIWAIKYLELLQIEPMQNAFNYQITTVFWGMVQKKLRWLKWLVDNYMEI